MNHIFINDVGYVCLRRTNTRNLRIAFGVVGNAELRMPKRYNLNKALRYLNSQKDWIIKHQPQESIIRENEFVLSYKIVRINSNENVIRVSNAKKTITARCSEEIFYHPIMQLKLHKAISKVLKAEADRKIPPLVEHHAKVHGIMIRKVRIANSTSRWGSCSPDNTVMITSYIVQLPAKLIEYVILHELAHIKEHNHSSKFWDEVKSLDDDYKQHRALLRKYRPGVVTRPTAYTV